MNQTRDVDQQFYLLGNHGFEVSLSQRGGQWRCVAWRDDIGHVVTSTWLDDLMKQLMFMLEHEQGYRIGGPYSFTKTASPLVAPAL